MIKFIKLHYPELLQKLTKQLNIKNKNITIE